MPAVAYRPRDHGNLVYRFFADATMERMETLDALFDSGARCAVYEDPRQAGKAYGFAIVMPDPQTAVWVHVKADYRKQGVAKALLQFLGVDLTKPITALFPSGYLKPLRRRGYLITLEPKTNV